MPDGERVIFTIADDQQTEQLYIMHIDSGISRVLSSRQAPNSHTYLLRPSSDGTQILWGVERLDANALGWYMVDVRTGFGEIMNPAFNDRWLREGNPLIFGDNRFANVPDSIEGIMVQRVAAAPNGQHLALTVAGRVQSPDTLYTIDPDGTNLTLVESAPYIGLALWSPDNLHIAYVGSSVSEPAEAVGDSLLLVNSQTVGSRVIVAGFETISQFEWSPDGEQLAFVVHDENMLYNLYIVDVDGSNLRQLATDITNPLTTKWRP
jgi:Tol biopolymer transport system component